MRLAIALALIGSEAHAEPGFRDGPPIAVSLAGGGGRTSDGATLGRLEAGAFLVDPDDVGVILGIVGGLEATRAGGGIPAGLVLGGRILPLVATISAGVDLLYFEPASVDVFAPYASVALGVNVRGFTLAIDARVEQHDRSSAAVMVGKTWEALRR